METALKDLTLAFRGLSDEDPEKEDLEIGGGGVKEKDPDGLDPDGTESLEELEKTEDPEEEEEPEM
jgi:hypothetical protein